MAQVEKKPLQVPEVTGTLPLVVLVLAGSNVGTILLPLKNLVAKRALSR